MFWGAGVMDARTKRNPMQKGKGEACWVLLCNCRGAMCLVTVLAPVFGSRNEVGAGAFRTVSGGRWCLRRLYVGGRAGVQAVAH